MKYSKYKQLDLRDCGPACIAFICGNYYDEKVTIAKCREYTKTDANGTNFRGMIEGAKRLGFSLDALSGSWQELKNELKTGGVSFPCIAHIINENNLMHFVVICNIKKNNVYYFDPARGKCKKQETEFQKMFSGYLLNIKDKKRCNSEDLGESEIKELFLIVGKMKQYFILVALLSVFIVCISVIASFAYQYLIDNMTSDSNIVETSTTTHEHSELQIEDGDEEILLSILYKLEKVMSQAEEWFEQNSRHLLFGVIGVYLIQMFMQIGRGGILAIISKRIGKKVSCDYIQKLLYLKEEFFHSRTEGEILTRFYDINEVCQMVTYVMFSVVIDIMFLIISGSVLLYINPLLFLLVCVVIILFLIVILVFRRPVEQVNRNAMEQYAVVVSDIKELISGNEIIKLYREGYKNRRGKIERDLEEYLKWNLKGGIIEGTENALSGFIQTGASILVLGMGVVFVEQGALTIGSLITFEMLLSFILYPIDDLVKAQPEIQRAMVSLSRLNDIRTISEEENAGNDKMQDAAIRFENVTFQYGYREELFHDLNFEIEKQSKCAFCGVNGVGKSTLAKLILRFYEVDKGCIYIGDKEIHSFELENLRKRIEYVPQTSFFFQGSIEENLRIARPDATEKEIIQACKDVELEEYITKLPDGLHFMIEEGGKNLSVGEKQKMALARSILKMPDIIVFDEALSGISSDAKGRIYPKLLQVFKTSTCIFITHELNEIDGLDCVFWIGEGNVIRWENRR